MTKQFSGAQPAGAAAVSGAGVKPVATHERAWITGLATAAVLLVAILLAQAPYGSQAAWLDMATMAAKTQVGLLILLCGLVAMILMETWRWGRTDSRAWFNKAPAYDAHFFAVGFLRYLEHLALLWLVQLFYHTAGEYGYASRHPFYMPWHQLLDVFFTAYCWLGLPYILLTRAFKWRSEVESRDYGLLLELGFWRLARYLPRVNKVAIDEKLTAIPGKTIFLDLLVKLFFLPLLFVFFNDQLSHLINNLGYVAAGMPGAFEDGQWNHTQWNFDLANLAASFFFTLHTGLAFCAMAISQRWLPQLGRANPRLAGWLACLLTFPPFLHMVITSHIPGVTGPHLDVPSQILAQLPSPWMLTLSVALMAIFYGFYLAATISLGGHFAEVTHRGIVRTGLYARVRHPAYAAKLLGWLCVLLPLAALNMYDGNWRVAGGLAGAYLIGVALYYWRALTEEQHLSEDPEYRDYCQKVRWRFIPGLW